MYRKAVDLIDKREDQKTRHEVHVISGKWKSFDFELKVYDGQQTKILDLGEISFDISQQKTCVGSFDGGYEPCPEQRPIDSFNQCYGCAPDDIPKMECIFEPQDCEDCEGGFCEEEHVVYLAFFGPISKIGMTKKKRLKQRVIEQGADAYALMATLENRKKAREEEKEISDRLNISQKVSSKDKLRRLEREIDKQMIRRKFRGIKNRIAVGELKYLEDYPISLPLRARPRLRPTPGRHQGERVGIKGGLLIYEYNGLQALDLSDLIGRNMLIDKRRC